MSQYYNIKITGGTSPGPYTVYYDLISNGTIATNFITNQPATNLTLSQLESGIVIDIPDSVSKIILYNIDCKKSQIFEISPGSFTNPSICLVIFDLFNGDSYNLQLTPSNTSINGKPLYTGSSITLGWTTNNYWELSGFSFSNAVFRSNDTDDIPETNWFVAGSSSSNYVVLAQTGSCSSISVNTSYLVANGFDASCSDDDGSINATAIGGAGGWEYSIDNGTSYQNIGIFTGLKSGSYIVSAKDIDGNIITEIVDVSAPFKNVFTVQPQTQLVSKLNKVNGLQKYSIEVTYDTSQIPVGEQITFDFKIIYSLLYEEPGIAFFDTSQNEVLKNGIIQPTILVDQTPFSKGDPLSCNDSYFVYLANKEYKSTSIVLQKNDVFTIKLVYGINTDSQGEVNGSCRTKGAVIPTLFFENITYSCNCCGMNENLVNVITQPQIYIP